MTNAADDAKKSGKVVRELALNEIDGIARNNVADDADNWGDEVDIPDLPRSVADLDAVAEIHVKISAVLGKTNMSVNDVLKLGRGAVIELERKVGEPVDVYLNDRLVARGEVVVVDDKLGITMTEIIKANKNK
ncbi:MAG: flagellar motor switch protein FliN [Rhodospirillaceae bacterium]